MLTNFVLLTKTDAESITPIVNVSIPVGGNTTFDCMIPELNHSGLEKGVLVKFGYSEKATKFEKIFHLKFDVTE